MKTIIVIPARFGSKRFPGKPLANIHGKPMISWVAKTSAEVVGIDNVFIATEDIRVKKAVIEMGYQVIMTSKNCLTGTDRLAEVANNIEADIYVNVQGDEPTVKSKDISKIIDVKKKNPNDIINGFTTIAANEDLNSANIPKVIFNESKYLVYMSRKKIPGFKEDKNKPKKYYKQVCIYAFNQKELLAFSKFGRRSILEQSEDIEILRFLELEKKILMVETEKGTIAVDEPSDVAKVEEEMKKL